MESLSLKLKKIKYHITEIGFSVMLFDHTYGKNGKVVYGQIHDIDIVDGIKKMVVIKFEERGHEYFITLPLFSNEYELIKIIKLKSMNLDENVTLTQLFLKTLDLGDTVNFIVSEYNGRNSYDIKNNRVIVSSLGDKNFKVNSNNKYTKGKYSCTNAYGLCASRRWVSFILFSYSDNIDIAKAQDYFSEILEDNDSMNVVFNITNYTKKRNQVNNKVRDYNSNIVFEYLDKIFLEGNEEIREEKI